MANFEIFAKGPPFALWPKSPILSTLQKICYFSANSCCFIEILLSVETRINSASIHTTQAKTRLVLTILQPFKMWPKNGQFRGFCKGSPLCTLAKIAHFEYPLENLPFLSKFFLFYRDFGISRNQNKFRIHPY